MKIYKIVFCIAAAVVLAAACKKDEESTDTPYLSGTMKFVESLPFFIEQGYEQTLRVKGVYHPEASYDEAGNPVDTLGYYVLNPFTSDKDTIKFFDEPVGTDVHYDFKVDRDTLGAFTLVYYAYAPGYYSSSVSSQFMVVKPGFGEGHSIRNFDTTGVKAVIGSKEYFVTEIDGVKWMRQNLADESKGVSYYKCKAMTDIFGQYYTWNEASTICPDGWELPSSEECDSLVAKYGGVSALMCDIYFNGTKASNKMWTYWPSVGALTDESRLSLFPTGYATKSGNNYDFYDVNVRAAFWTKNELDGKGVVRYIYEDQNRLFSSLVSKTDFAANVRCIKK